MTATIEGTQEWLDTIPLIDVDEVDAEMYSALVQQISRGSPLETLLGLLSAERQALLLRLSLLPITTSAEAARASVLQGTIQGIARARETVLELVQRAVATAQTGGTNNGN